MPYQDDENYNPVMRTYGTTSKVERTSTYQYRVADS